MTVEPLAPPPPGRAEVRHDAKYSPAVVEILREIVPELPGPVVDPFAGLGRELDGFGRDDVVGIELEPEWADCSPVVRQGDALDPLAYPDPVGSVVCSPCYGNRLSDQYLGPRCGSCGGTGWKHSDRTGVRRGRCGDCGGVGHDSSGRYSYAISLGRKVSEGSAARLAFMNGEGGREYREFHQRWLYLMARLIAPGERRLVVNMSDHFRTERKGGPQQRQYACAWWVTAMARAGFHVVEAYHAGTRRIGHGSNQQVKADTEMVFVADLLDRRSV